MSTERMSHLDTELSTSTDAWAFEKCWPGGTPALENDRPNYERVERPGPGRNSGKCAPEVINHVRSILVSLNSPRATTERRRDHRYPYPQLLYLTPLSADGFTPNGASVVVVGKNLSERGLGFYHREPIAYRKMIASLADNQGGWTGVVIDLTWCRFTPFGWYESGGRFLNLVKSPIPSERHSQEM
jgi:hypothetical protein